MVFLHREPIVHRARHLNDIQRARLGLRPGEFFWQDAGTTGAVKNIGTTPINIVEFELK
jgi:hypothetical protein